MKRRITATMLASLLVMTMAFAPATAAPRPNDHAKPTIIDFDDIEEDIAAEFTALCGFPVDVDIEGWVKIIPLDTAGDGRRQPLEIDVYHISSQTFSSDGRTFQAPLDVGPDVIYLEDGVVKVALTGRSTTGSGVIGRVVINTQTGEIEFEAGRRVFADFGDAVCEALTPPA
jgi:hypothetical protein